MDNLGCNELQESTDTKSIATGVCNNTINHRNYAISKDSFRAPKSKSFTCLRENYLPPSGPFAIKLCLILSTLAVFLVARCVLGEIASVGGTVFALLVLVVLALLGGQLVVFTGNLLSKLLKAKIKLPALLGMLIVGILLKNIPYNFGQFGRLECSNGTILDTVNELDDINEHSSFKKRSADLALKKDLNKRFKRSSFHFENITHVNINVTEEELTHCDPRYIGHELDPFISRALRMISLNVILLMAGLEIDPDQLWNMKGLVLRATLIPCLVETTSVAVLANVLLGN